MIPEILYDDSDICVCIKPAGLVSETGGFTDVVSQWYASIGGDPDIYTVHRLDTAVSGLMVYARNKSSASRLSSEISEHNMLKQYLAVISGTPEADAGTYTDLLFKDSSTNKSYVVKRLRRGVREATLSYEVLEKCGNRSLLLVTLETGRSHQIRVQFSSRGTPLLGDVKYGGEKGCPIALYSHRLSFPHPSGKGTIDITHSPDKCYPWSLFKYVEKQ